MKPAAKLIKTVEKSWLPTIHPVYYYGMPNNQVWVVYVTPCGLSGLYLNVDIVKNFKYDYEKEVWIKPTPNKADMLNVEKDIDRLVVCGKSIAVIQLRRKMFPPLEITCKPLVEKLFRDANKLKEKPSSDKKQSTVVRRKPAKPFPDKEKSTIKRNKWKGDQK